MKIPKNKVCWHTIFCLEKIRNLYSSDLIKEVKNAGKKSFYNEMKPFFALIIYIGLIIVTSN